MTLRLTQIVLVNTLTQSSASHANYLCSFDLFTTRLVERAGDECALGMLENILLMRLTKVSINRVVWIRESVTD